MDEAVDFLNEILLPAGKLVEQNHIEEIAMERDITKSALRRAKKKLQIRSVFIGKAGEGCWFWKLQEDEGNTDNT